MDFRHFFHPELFGEKAVAQQPSGQTEFEDDDPVQAFYTLCEQDFHNTAARMGHAKHGIISVPELLPLGRKTVLSFLKNEAYQLRYGSKPDDYYYIILSLCIQAGTVLAFRWQNDYAGLQVDGVTDLLKEGPSASAAEIFNVHLHLDRQLANRFFRKIYTRWRILMSPYWELKNSRDFTCYSMLAAFQLGVSLILDKYSSEN